MIDIIGTNNITLGFNGNDIVVPMKEQKAKEFLLIKPVIKRKRG